MKTSKFYEPASYGITMDGILLDGTFPIFDDGEHAKSHLLVRVKDQAELSGVLNTLYSLQYVILKIEKMDTPSFMEYADRSTHGGDI